MKIKGLIDEDFVNYKKPSMFIIMPNCSFKCDKEAGCEVCQNSDLAAAPVIEIDEIEIAKRFYKNSITGSVTIGGLEPFDDFGGLISLISAFTMVGIANNQDTPEIVIYTGYYPDEINNELIILSRMADKIIIKFGRFIPNKPDRYDDLLGVTLASDNQYSARLEDILE